MSGVPNSVSINYEEQFAFYLAIIKPLVSNLSDPNDRIKAKAWIKKLENDSSILPVRIDYLKLFLMAIERKKLSGAFAGLPDYQRQLHPIPKETILRNAANSCIEKDKEIKFSQTISHENFRRTIKRSNEECILCSLEEQIQKALKSTKFNERITYFPPEEIRRDSQELINLDCCSTRTPSPQVSILKKINFNNKTMDECFQCIIQEYRTPFNTEIYFNEDENLQCCEDDLKDEIEDYNCNSKGTQTIDKNQVDTWIQGCGLLMITLALFWMLYEIFSLFYKPLPAYPQDNDLGIILKNLWRKIYKLLFQN